MGREINRIATKLDIATRIVVVLAAVVGAACVLAPYVRGGYPVGDSYYFNVPWTAFFADQVADGDFYPRWLVDYANGLGAPVFYFYAPAPFFMAAAISFLSGGANFETALIGTHLALYLLSAASFYALARSFAGPVVGIATAALYAVIPYHVIDLEVRGAIGEAAAYVFTPLVLLGLLRSEKTGRLPLLAAIAFAGLLLSHLPSAVLFSLALGVYAAARSALCRNLKPIGAVAVAGFGGALLASIYLVPALTLGKHLAPDGWLEVAGAYFYPENWLLFGPTGLDDHADRIRTGFTAAQGISTGLAVFATVIAAAFGHLQSADRRAFDEAQAKSLVCAFVVLAFCWLMMTDLARPAYLHIGVMRLVQFPWRIGVVIDLFAAMIVALCAARIVAVVSSHADARFKIVAYLAGWMMIAATAWGVVGVGSAIAGGVARTKAHDRSLAAEIARLKQPLPANASPESIWAEYPGEYRTRWLIESAEYALVAGASPLSEAHANAYRRWRAAVIEKPPASVAGNGTINVARTGPTIFAIDASLKDASEARLRRVYFPAWRLYDATSGAEIELRPGEDDGLMAFDLPAGEHSLILKTVPLPTERIGAAISAATLIAILLILLRRRLQRGGASVVTWPIFRPGKASRLP